VEGRGAHHNHGVSPSVWPRGVNWPPPPPCHRGTRTAADPHLGKNCIANTYFVLECRFEQISACPAQRAPAIQNVPAATLLFLCQKCDRRRPPARALQLCTHLMDGAMHTSAHVYIHTQCTQAIAHPNAAVGCAPGQCRHCSQARECARHQPSAGTPAYLQRGQKWHYYSHRQPQK
jgi:hypothetical protein